MDNIIFRDGILYLIKSKGRRPNYDHLDVDICQYYSRHGFILSCYPNSLLNPNFLDSIENVHVIHADAKVIGMQIDNLYDIFAITQHSVGTKLRYNKVYLGNLYNQFSYILALNTFTKLALIDKLENRLPPITPDVMSNVFLSVSKNVRAIGDRYTIKYINFESMRKHIDLTTLDYDPENIKHMLSDWTTIEHNSSLPMITELSKEDLKIFNYLNVNF